MGIRDDHYWMGVALDEARKAADINEVPVGAVIVRNDEVIGKGFNRVISSDDATAHAEIVAIRDASRNVGNYRLVGADLYVTLEPCTMCVGAIVHARIKRLVVGALEPKAGAVFSQNNLLHHSAMNHEVSYAKGILEDECGQLISNFFAARREQHRRSKQAQ